MELNSDFDVRAAVHADALDWIASPMPGVSRRMLDRIGDEVARATTIVRYDPGSHFSPHVHDGGEEFLVLDGVFQDEHGDYPAGSYIRNPPTTSHTPGAEAGCEIFVKLWQFDPDDRDGVRLNAASVVAEPSARVPGGTMRRLFANDQETVSIENWPSSSRFELRAPAGAELLVIAGDFVESGERFRRYSWLRLPIGATSGVTTGPDGAEVWIKEGHLRFVDVGGPGRNAG